MVENDRQPRTDAVAPIHTGLQNIQRRYCPLPDRPVEIVPKPDCFVVRLPLLPHRIRVVGIEDEPLAALLTHAGSVSQRSKPSCFAP